VESFSVAGQAVITDLIENYPGFPDGTNGFELIDKFKKQAEKFGVEFIVGHVKSVKEHIKDKMKFFRLETEDKTYESLSAIIASGARPKYLEAPGEEALRGKGVSYCATCDGPLFKDKEAVVIGGGNSAIEEAIFLTKFAKKVTVVHRRNQLRADHILQQRAFSNKKLEFIWDSVVTEVIGKKTVSSIKVQNVKTKNEIELACQGVFVFVGYMPNTEFLKGFVETDEHNAIIVDSNMKTSQEGIFAAGDCCKKLLRQIVTAVGEGATAAFASQMYVEELKHGSRLSSQTGR
jgi:thioredoxin reductase (NADPH)